jgi:dynein heavy chain
LKIEPSQDNIKQLFVQRVRDLFHIALCMSPVGDDLRLRCRQFPSLVNCCTLDWFSRWNSEALLYVSQTFLKDLDLPNEEIRKNLTEISEVVHTSVESSSESFYNELRRRVYTTPKSYLDLISLYLNTLKTKREEYNANKNRLASGLSKLNYTNTQIAELKIKLAEMQPILVKKNADLKITLENVSKDKAEADEKEAVVMEEKEVVEKKAAEAKEIADDAENDVRAAQPQLEKAKTAVAALTKDAIVELKSFNSPPDAVALVMEPVMILTGKAKDWKTAKSEMSDANKFLTGLKNFDVSKVKESTLKTIRSKYFGNKDFNPDFIGSKSVPAGHLCSWILALSQYQIVYKNIVPKKAKLAEVTKILKEAQDTLNEKLAIVKQVKDAVAALQAQAQTLLDEKAELEANMAQSSGRMGRAEKLVVLLADEGVRWKETVATLEVEIENLVGDVFLSCACISYFGGFTGSYRTTLTEKWS